VRLYRLLSYGLLVLFHVVVKYENSQREYHGSGLKEGFILRFHVIACWWSC